VGVLDLGVTRPYGEPAQPDVDIIISGGFIGGVRAGLGHGFVGVLDLGVTRPYGLLFW